MGSSVATSSDATSLTTFPSSLAVASLLYVESNVPVVKLFFLSSSDVATTKATKCQGMSEEHSSYLHHLWFSAQ